MWVQGFWRLFVCRIWGFRGRVEEEGLCFQVTDGFRFSFAGCGLFGFSVPGVVLFDGHGCCNLVPRYGALKPQALNQTLRDGRRVLLGPV